MKKRIIIFSFILISMFSIGNFLIYSAYLYSYQNDYRTYIKQNKKTLNSSKVILNPSELYANSSTITWEDNNKEIIMNGVLYDVISITYDEGKVNLIVLSDDQEAEMKKEFASTYDAYSSKSSSNPIKLLKQFLSLKFLTHSDNLSSNDDHLENHFYALEQIARLKNVYLSLETPPPSK